MRHSDLIKSDICTATQQGQYQLILFDGMSAANHVAGLTPRDDPFKYNILQPSVQVLEYIVTFSQSAISIYLRG